MCPAVMPRFALIAFRGADGLAAPLAIASAPQRPKPPRWRSYAAWSAERRAGRWGGTAFASS